MFLPICCSLSTIFLEFPISVVEWADLTSLQPSRDAVEMEGMIADSPSNGTLFTCCRCLICLTLDAQVHDMVSADSTIVYNDIPGPQSNGVPLLDLKALLAICGSITSASLGFAGCFLYRCCRARWRVCHIYICHVLCCVSSREPELRDGGVRWLGSLAVLCSCRASMSMIVFVVVVVVYAEDKSRMA